MRPERVFSDPSAVKFPEPGAYRIQISNRRSSRIMYPPDNLEKGIRLGCGAFFFGLSVGALIGFQALPYGKWPIFGTAVLTAAAFSLAARYFGDKFWYLILWILSWR